MTTYFDYAATTPVDERVLEAMLPYFSEKFGNANSLYALGRDAYRAVEEARESVAKSINAERPDEVIFTGGGTESDNAALIGILTKLAPKGDAHLIVSAFEHHAILEPAEWLEKQGFELTVLKPREDGHIHPDDLRAAMKPNTKLVSIMHANNEIGTINPIKELAAVAHEGGALFHTDAAQTLGKIPFDVQELGVDAASFSSHKIYGPKGFGALYLKKRTPFTAYLKGGGQEFKKRSGTQNTPGAIGFAKALEIMVAEQAAESARLTAPARQDHRRRDLGPREHRADDHARRAAAAAHRLAAHQGRRRRGHAPPARQQGHRGFDRLGVLVGLAGAEPRASFDRLPAGDRSRKPAHLARPFHDRSGRRLLPRGLPADRRAAALHVTRVREDVRLQVAVSIPTTIRTRRRFPCCIPTR